MTEVCNSKAFLGVQLSILPLRSLLNLLLSPCFGWVQVILRGNSRLDCLVLRRKLPNESRTRRSSVLCLSNIPFFSSWISLVDGMKSGRPSTKRLWCCSESFKLQEEGANPVLFFGQPLLKGSVRRARNLNLSTRSKQAGGDSLWMATRFNRTTILLPFTAIPYREPTSFYARKRTTFFRLRREESVKSAVMGGEKEREMCCR